MVIDSRKDDEVEILDEKEEMRDNMNDVIINDLFKQDEEKVKKVMEEKEVISEDNAIESIFNNFNEKDEKFVTYYVHIVRENDNIDSICMKYGVSTEQLKEYNNIEQITLGTKIIVPYIQNETI